MATDRIPIKGSNRATYNILSDDVTSANGITLEDVADAQILKVAHGAPGEANIASAEFPFPIADANPALSPLAVGGLSVASNQEVELVPANGGRVKVSVNHTGADGSGNVWLGFGVTAAQNVGEWIEPGGRWEEFYAGSVRVLNKGAGAITLTWMEWAA